MNSDPPSLHPGSDSHSDFPLSQLDHVSDSEQLNQGSSSDTYPGSFSISDWFDNIYLATLIVPASEQQLLKRKIMNQIRWFLGKITQSNIQCPQVSDENTRSRYISYQSSTKGRSFESEEKKNSRITASVSLYDSVFFSENQWYVRAQHSDTFISSLKTLSATFSSLSEKYPPPSSNKLAQLPRQQYCVICCKKTNPQHTRISALKLNPEELNDLCTIINAIRKKRPGRVGRRIGDYNCEKLLEQKVCESHIMLNASNDFDGVNEAIQENSPSPRTPLSERRSKVAQSFERFKNEKASEILTQTKISLEYVTNLLNAVSSQTTSKFSGELISSASSEIYSNITQFIESFRAFQSLVDYSSDESLLSSIWLNDEAFSHDTTFPSTSEFISFCKSENLTIPAALSAVFYLRGMFLLTLAFI